MTQTYFSLRVIRLSAHQFSSSYYPSSFIQSVASSRTKFQVPVTECDFASRGNALARECLTAVRSRDHTAFACTFTGTHTFVERTASAGTLTHGHAYAESRAVEVTHTPAKTLVNPALRSRRRGVALRAPAVLIKAYQFEAYCRRYPDTRHRRGISR